jgi:hypothetical protein
MIFINLAPLSRERGWGEVDLYIRDEINNQKRLL